MHSAKQAVEFSLIVAAVILEKIAQKVRKKLFLLNRPWQPTFTREHQRQAVRLLRDLRQEVGRPQLPLQAQEDPQRRQAPQVPLLHQEVYPEVNQLLQVHS